jgi:glycerol-3-phosphate dehydrogenase
LEDSARIMIEPRQLDLLVIGGGINGCGIARDAVGRGLSVMLVEEADLASATSSASTKLIHGGLRYLELYELRLVREALIERERLQAVAPHIIRPLRFVLPHDTGIRPAWMVRIGLFLYDHLATRKSLPGSETIRLERHAFGKPLKGSYKTGFAYSDCSVPDSRLVVLTAMDASERGAQIATRTRFVSARRSANGWEAELQDVRSGARSKITARLLVNAAGPWVSDVLQAKLAVKTAKHVRMVKGSHIVVRRRYEGEQAYIFQNPDKRIVFAIPYEDQFTLIGTTDVPYEGDPRGIAISEEETRYLCASVNHFLAREVTPRDVVWSYAGVRPLYDDGSIEASVVTRDYVFDLDAPDGEAPVLSIFGGKITTFRRLAEHAMDEIGRFFPKMGGAWTAKASLPGGDIPNGDIDGFTRDLQARKPFLSVELAGRLARSYGTRVDRIVKDAKTAADLGRDFGRGLSEAEIEYLRRSEWAETAQDILWRRSKLGLHLPETAAANIDQYLQGGLRPAEAALRPWAPSPKHDRGVPRASGRDAEGG